LRLDESGGKPPHSKMDWAGEITRGFSIRGWFYAAETKRGV